MSDCDLSAMESYMSQPLIVWCDECGWEGFDYELIEGKCPKCENEKVKNELYD